MASAAQNSESIIKFMREIWSKGDNDVADDILDPNFQFILAFAHLDGREAFKGLVKRNREIFENLVYHVDDDEGDVVASETKGAGFWRMTSKQVGTWRNVPARGDDISIKGITFFKFSPEGKMVEARVQNDVMGMMRQIGGIKALYDF